MTDKISLRYKKKSFSLEAKKLGFFGKITGLMFTGKRGARALLFDFGKFTKVAIHSWFVFFPFIALWLDDKNKILELKVVKPFSFPICPEKKFVRLVEIPLNKKYRSLSKLLFS